MSEAVKAVEMRKLSIRKASIMYNVPKSTLHDRVSGKVDLEGKPGKKPYLSIEEEEELVSFLLKCAEIGYAHTRPQVLSLVQRIVESKDISEHVSDSWWRRFQERHPILKLRTAMPLSMARGMAMDKQVLDTYFDILESTLVDNGILNNPSCIYNCDETGMPLSPKPLKVVDAVGAKNPSYITGDSKQQITVLACTSAAGAVVPPLVIFNRKTLPMELARGEVPGTCYGLSEKGWITRDIFQSWFIDHFLIYAPATRPLLLLLDGHSTHYCPEVIRMASEHKIILFALPPHTTNLTQPLDKSAVSALKVCWRQTCHKFLVSHPGRVVTHYDFSSLLAEAWDSAMTLRNVIAGFKVTGVCPFDRDAVLERLPAENFTKFKPESLPQSSGLAYIPLYSPGPRPHSPKKPVKSSILKISGLLQESSSSDDGDLDKCVLMSPKVRTLSKFLRTPVPPSMLPTKRGKSSGSVLTSFENMRIMEAKEEAKKEKVRAKEERKRLREEKKRAKEDRKKTVEEQRRVRQDSSGKATGSCLIISSSVHLHAGYRSYLVICKYLCMHKQHCNCTTARVW